MGRQRRRPFALGGTLSDAFDKHFSRILLLIITASVFGGGAIRFGNDRLADEVSKLRELFQELNVRVGNLEALVIPRPK
jgi:hypothetical protein